MPVKQPLVAASAHVKLPLALRLALRASVPQEARRLRERTPVKQPHVKQPLAATESVPVAADLLTSFDVRDLILAGEGLGRGSVICELTDGDAHGCAGAEVYWLRQKIQNFFAFHPHKRQPDIFPRPPILLLTASCCALGATSRLRVGGRRPSKGF